MLACAAAVCLFQLASLVPGKTDFTIVDMNTGEMLKVEWLSPEITKNILGDTCWLYDGMATSSCEDN